MKEDKYLNYVRARPRGKVITKGNIVFAGANYEEVKAPSLYKFMSKLKPDLVVVMNRGEDLDCEMTFEKEEEYISSLFVDPHQLFSTD